MVEIWKFLGFRRIRNSQRMGVWEKLGDREFLYPDGPDYAGQLKWTYKGWNGLILAEDNNWKWDSQFDLMGQVP